jgi:hypothetical protein
VGHGEFDEPSAKTFTTEDTEAHGVDLEFLDERL